jgi:S1-C subfamily serine protease
MKKYFQWGINLLVIFIFVSLWVLPYVESFSSYEDSTIPDEVAALDTEIDDVLAGLDPNFEELYNNPIKLGSFDFSYVAPGRMLVSNQDNYKESVESIVYISIEDEDGFVYFGSGSILTPDGVIMTNYHVVEGSVKVVVTTSAGVHYPVIGVIASDELLDITFLKIDADNLNPIAIGDSDFVEIGDETLVIGHAEGFINTLSVGNVAGFRNYASQGFGTNIQITNPISMGNSGGAVINTYGEIIGIPTWSIEYDENIIQVQNLNFAVPINEALALLIE